MTRIVEDGRARSMETPEYRDARVRIEAEVMREFEPGLARATVFGRLWLRWRMKRELRRRMDRLAPEDACYLVERQAGR